MQVRVDSQICYSTNEEKKPHPLLAQGPLQHHLCKQLLCEALCFFPFTISADCTLSSLLSLSCTDFDPTNHLVVSP